MRSVAAQRHRVNRVINFAQARFGEPLGLDALADVACLSKFHFTRVFQSHLKQTPVEFITRLRLEHAARAMMQFRDKRITDIALEAGFSGSQAFSRAFRNRFQSSPSDFRKDDTWRDDGLPGTIIPGGRNYKPAPSAGDFLETSPVRIEARPAYRVAYLRHFGPYFNTGGSIGKTFDTLAGWAYGKGLWHVGAEMIGLCPDNPALTLAGHCIYDACLPVPDDIAEDDLVSIQTIPAGTFAVMHAKCPSNRLYAVWKWLTDEWLVSRNMAYDFRQSYEYYPAINGAPGCPDTGVDLCMRLKSR